MAEENRIKEVLKGESAQLNSVETTKSESVLLERFAKQKAAFVQQLNAHIVQAKAERDQIDALMKVSVERAKKIDQLIGALEAMNGLSA